MKTLVRRLGIVVLCLGLLGGTSVSAAESKPRSKAPGAQLATTISTVTGVAISPLLGTGAYGAMTYYRTDEDKRANLPWFAQPKFWIPALTLVALCALKDILGTTAPTALKKPFDIAEALENKVSGLIAAGLFVPLIVNVFGDSAFGPSASLFSSMGVGAVEASSIYNALLVPVAILAFIMVWLVGNAINVLIVISPFTTVDAALKAVRLALFVSVPATAALNPWLGAVWALIIILISCLIAGWSLRLTHFGAVFVWDLLTFRRKRFRLDPKENKLFLARKINKVPVRTYGRLAKNEAGKLVFNYHPWLVLPKRTLEIPVGRYEAGCGALYSEIMKVEGQETRTMLHLPPCYRGREAELAKLYALDGTREVGLKAMWTWLKGMFGFRKPIAAVA